MASYPLYSLFILYVNIHVISTTDYYREAKGLTEIPNDIPTDVTDIFLRDNAITSIPAYAFTSYPYLGTVDFKNNLITDLSPYAFCNTQIYSITLVRNPLNHHPNLSCIAQQLLSYPVYGMNITNTPTDTLVNFDSLETINFAGLIFPAENMTVFEPIEDTLEDLKMYHSSFTGSTIGTTFQNFTKLLYVKLEGNPIHAFHEDAFKSTTSLGEFVCPKCELEQFPDLTAATGNSGPQE